MTDMERPIRNDPHARHAPFVVTEPCGVCQGRGDVDGQACAACHGTGAGRFYHGTKANLESGDLITPGYAANFGDPERTTNFDYFTGTLDAAIWGAELSLGDGRGRIYIVEPTGTIEDDPNLTDRRYPGNPTRSYRSREPVRVVGEVLDWDGHPPEQLRAMKDGLARLARDGVQPLDD